MNNEQQKAKELAEMIDVLSKAELKPNGDYANVEIYDTDFEKWMLCPAPSWNFSANEYRIKPETRRVALIPQDLIDRELSGKTMRLSNSELILSWHHNFLKTVDNAYCYSYLLDNDLTFLDGTPCSKEVESE